MKILLLLTLAVAPLVSSAQVEVGASYGYSNFDIKNLGQTPYTKLNPKGADYFSFCAFYILHNDIQLGATYSHTSFRFKENAFHAGPIQLGESANVYTATANYLFLDRALCPYVGLEAGYLTASNNNISFHTTSNADGFVFGANVGLGFRVYKGFILNGQVSYMKSWASTEDIGGYKGQTYSFHYVPVIIGLHYLFIPEHKDIQNAEVVPLLPN